MAGNKGGLKYITLALAIGFAAVALFADFQVIREAGSQTLGELLGTRRTLTQFEPGRSQVIAGGIDPALVEIDRAFATKIIALIREGSTPIEAVELLIVGEAGETEFFASMERTDRRLGDDIVYETQLFSFAAVGFAPRDLEGLSVPILFGSDPGDFIIAVFDVEGRAHFFPNIEFAAAPPAPPPTYGEYGGATAYSSIFN